MAIIIKSQKAFVRFIFENSKMKMKRTIETTEKIAMPSPAVKKRIFIDSLKENSLAVKICGTTTAVFKKKDIRKILAINLKVAAYFFFIRWSCLVHEFNTQP